MPGISTWQEWEGPEAWAAGITWALPWPVAPTAGEACLGHSRKGHEGSTEWGQRQRWGTGHVGRRGGLGSSSETSLGSWWLLYLQRAESSAESSRVPTYGRLGWAELGPECGRPCPQGEKLATST